MKKLLIFVSLTGIAAVVGAVVVGTVMFDGTVVGNPYERGIAWDEEKKRRLSSGLKVSIDPAPFRKGKNEIVVRVLDEKDEPVAAEGLALFFSGQFPRTTTAGTSPRNRVTVPTAPRWNFRKRGAGR